MQRIEAALAGLTADEVSRVADSVESAAGVIVRSRGCRSPKSLTFKRMRTGAYALVPDRPGALPIFASALVSAGELPPGVRIGRTRARVDAAAWQPLVEHLELSGFDVVVIGGRVG